MNIRTRIINEFRHKCNDNNGVKILEPTTKPRPKPDNIKSPSHYKISDKYESVDIIKDLQTKEEFTGWCWGNILKYVFRWKKKNGVEDLKKARVYLDWLIREVEG